MSTSLPSHPRNIRFEEESGRLFILDQTLLPREEREVCIETVEQMEDALARLRVRGAPAIGIFAAFCVYVLACGIDEPDAERFIDELTRQAHRVRTARPTAVNLAWAVDRMLRCARAAHSEQREACLQRLLAEARAIQEEDIARCRAISEYGLSLLHEGDGVLTHCNAGPLATSLYGTGLGPLLLARERGIRLSAYVDETRPLLQGARLTAYELSQAGIETTLICDNMASMVMRNGWVQACLIGCDRIAANGDTANKIGSSGVAVLAHHYGIPFYVLGPTSTIDASCATGDDIPIELRDGEEIRSAWYVSPQAPADVACYNPAFDVTDHRLITAIITEEGIHYPPYDFSAR